MIIYKRDYIVFGAFLLVLVMHFIHVIASNRVSTEGNELVAIEKQVQEMKVANSELRVQYLEATSFTTIMKEAKAMGFQEIKDEDYLYL